eukprot:GHVS01093969.1.p1 GENE.GHVS01093969.1~~GHVS01093969.1.p1  ORF type:complete len:300 (+),score=59.89 GHVS01093969.1:107-1006(+)
MEFRFYYDIGSMYSYFAFCVLSKYLLKQNTTTTPTAVCSKCPSLKASVLFTGDGLWSSVYVRMCPVLVGGIFQQTGNMAPASVPAKAMYTLTDTARLAAELNIECSIPPLFPPNTLLVMRLLTSIALYAPETLWAATHCLFHAYWGKHLDIQDTTVLAQSVRSCFSSMSLAETLIKLSNGQQVKHCLRANTESAVSSGAFGVPWFSISSSNCVNHIDNSAGGRLVVDNNTNDLNTTHAAVTTTTTRQETKDNKESVDSNKVESYFGVDRMYQLASTFRLPWYGLNPNNDSRLKQQLHKL